MGLIADLQKHKGVALNSGYGTSPDARSAVERGRNLWREIFNRTDKETPHGKKRPNDPNAVPGGTYGRGITNEAPAFKRLLQAMRSMAPGGWSDDRWEQTQHLTGIIYIAIHRICTQWQQAQFKVYRKDKNHPDGKRLVDEDDQPEGRDGITTPYDLVKLLEHPNNQDYFGQLLYRCFPAGTRVRMKDGSQKPIEKVGLLDEVLTAEGNVHKVRKCYAQKYKGDLVKLKLWGHSHLQITPHHEILTQRGYVPAEELISGDWVVIPRYKPSEIGVLQTEDHIRGEISNVVSRAGKAYLIPSTDGTRWPGGYKRVPDFLKLTPGLGRIIGLYLAEGHTTKAGRVCWSFNISEMDTLAAELVELLEQELGLKATIKIMNTRGTVALVYIGGKLWARLFESLCGKWSYGKRIHSDLLCGPDEFLTSLFSGWIDGDGYVVKHTRGYISGATVSHELALNMFDIANYLGYRPALRLQKPSKSGGIIRRPVWLIKLSHMEEQDKKCSGPDYSSLEDGMMWRKVRELKREPYYGDVFNLGVEGDNSYVAEGLGVHNCGQQKYLTGTALTWMVPNKFGVPCELYCIPTSIAIPQPAINPDYPDGYYRIQPLYPYGPFSSYPTPATAVGAPVPAQWMLRTQFPHPLLRYDGYAPLTGLSEELDALEMMNRSRHYKMRRSINPSAVLQMDEMEGAEPLPEAEIERIHAEFENSFEGPENAGNLYVASPGCRLEEWGATPKDMDYSSGWDQLTAFGLAGFGISKPAAGMVEASAYANVWAALKQLHVLTLKPDLDGIAADLTHHLAPFFGDDLIIEIETPRIDDRDQLKQKIDSLVAAKAITKNEVRKLWDEPVWEEGDEKKDGEALAGSDPAQEQQQGMPGMEGAPGAEQGMGSEGEESSQEAGQEGEESSQEADQLEAENADLLGAEQPNEEEPAAGNLGEGSLGPRKSLNGHTKHLPYSLVRKSLNGVLKPSNGHIKKKKAAVVVSKENKSVTILKPVFNVTIGQPSIQIDVPRLQPTPVRVENTVNVPESPVPQLTLTMPTFETESQIDYDDFGRPAKVKRIQKQREIEEIEEIE